MALAKPVREKGSLVFKAFNCRVVPNHVVGSGDFFREIKLRADPQFGELISKTALLAETRAQSGWRESDNDDSLETGFRGSFK
jgi:hypothetical protein